jgi:hypothetical protein
MFDAYEKWQAAAEAARDFYERWSTGPRDRQLQAYAVYVAALDIEEAAARDYETATNEVVRAKAALPT